MAAAAHSSTAASASLLPTVIPAMATDRCSNISSDADDPSLLPILMEEDVCSCYLLLRARYGHRYIDTACRCRSRERESSTLLTSILLVRNLHQKNCAEIVLQIYVPDACARPSWKAESDSNQAALANNASIFHASPSCQH
jgi:hypothetical protein